MWFIYVFVSEQFLVSQLFHFSQKHNSVRGWGKTQKLGSREALLLHTHRWVMTTQKERLMRQPLSLTSPLTRVRWGGGGEKDEEKRISPDLTSPFTKVQESVMDEREMEGVQVIVGGRESWCVALSAVAEGWWNGLWYWLLIFPLPSAERTEERREALERRAEGRRMRKFTYLYWQTQHNHCRCT